MEDCAIQLSSSPLFTQGDCLMSGYIKQNRTEHILEILKSRRNHDAYILLNVVALRAKRTKTFSTHNLEVGEALIGDHKSYGMSEQNYRTAKKKLETWG